MERKREHFPIQHFDKGGQDQGGLSRSNSMRASLRLLGSRFRSSSLSAVKKIAPPPSPVERGVLIEHFAKRWTENVKSKVSPTKENIPANLIFREKVQIPKKDGAFRKLKRSISLKGDHFVENVKQSIQSPPQRLATIRRASVWANSVTSKLYFFQLLRKCL
ncbi:hypothetical protein DMENIID0001_026610 [Sergentomyia squamirostris]